MAEIQQDEHPFAKMVKDEWGSGSTVQAWQFWHSKTKVHLAHMTQTLLDVAQISQGQQVLDLASGSGEPALDLANIVGPEGHVVATDLSNSMLELAKENCSDCSNISFQQADVHDLPFNDNCFDVVTCRLGIMYFWDCQKALKEILRVLKPGGRAVFIAWGDMSKNLLVNTLIGPFAKRKALPKAPTGIPNSFRFAEPGSLVQEMNNAGFFYVEDQQKVIPCPWPGPPEELWKQIYEMAAPLRPYFDGFEIDQREMAKKEVIETFNNYYDGIHTDPSTCIVAALGYKLL